MPYLLLVIGLLLAFYAFSRFFANASYDEIRIFIRNGSAVIVGLAIVLLAITGRLGIGLAILFMILPIWLKFFQNAGFTRRKTKTDATSATMSEEEALEVLGLASGANEDEIQDAYKKLMQKVHPDNQGSDWMAAKLNQARDILLIRKNI